MLLTILFLFKLPNKSSVVLYIFMGFSQLRLLLKQNKKKNKVLICRNVVFLMVYSFEAKYINKIIHKKMRELKSKDLPIMIYHRYLMRNFK